MTLAIDWQPTLRHRRGGLTRLDGLDVYYDFDWEPVIGHGTAQFAAGQHLAALMRQCCPPDLNPALLLTTAQTGRHLEVIRTDEHYVLVVDIEVYRRGTANVNRALAHVAARLGPEGLMGLAELALEPDAIARFVETRMDIETVMRWAGNDPEKLAELRRVAGAGAPRVETPMTPTQLAAGLRALEELDPRIVEAVAAMADRGARLELLQMLTSNPEGIEDAGSVIVGRTPDRIAAARASIVDYERRLEDGESETELQSYIEANPWLLGIEYTQVRHRHGLPRGELDFILDRYDGYYDVLELKSPHDPIIIAPDINEFGEPPSARGFRLSPELANAFAQAHVYRDVLDQMAGTIDHLYGLRETRHPLLIIVIGQASLLPEHRLRVLREINLSLHRVAVIPYDILGRRASTILDNVERHLLDAPQRARGAEGVD